MTVTSNSTGTELTFTHPLLTTAISNTITLTREYSCTSTVLPINTTGLSVFSSSFIINLNRFYGTGHSKTKFDDGVYKFTLYFEYTISGKDNGGVTTTSCFVMDYDLKCKILENNDPTVLNKYRTMFFADDCDTCNCSHLCTIYNDLVQDPTIIYNDCSGCN